MDTAHHTADRLLQRGMAQARAGNSNGARRLIRRAVALNPANEAAWLYLAGLAAHPAEAAGALNRVQTLNPANPHLETAWGWVKQTWPDARPALPRTSPPGNTDPSRAPGRRRKAATLRLALVSLVAALGLTAAALGIAQTAAATVATTVAATPTNTPAQTLALLKQQLDAARSRADQPAMIAVLENMRALAPADAGIAAQLAQQYFEQGMVLRNGGNFAQAKTAFEYAAAIHPPFEAAAAEARLAELYLTGVRHHQQAAWAAAAEALEQVYRQNPAYPYIDEILYSTYYNLGLVNMHREKLTGALQAFQRAAEILPAAPQAPRKVSEVSLLLNPPTPTPEPTPTALPPTSTPTAAQKRVVVDISEQRAYAYRGDSLVYNFIVSTGEPGRDTAVGQFEILNKLPMAYASTWNLDMPYWLGVYWSGPLQNGFHALPTVRHTGYTLWDGYLGQRVSYGCIILSYADARTLYNWVDIGTPVTIRY